MKENFPALHALEILSLASGKVFIQLYFPFNIRGQSGSPFIFKTLTIRFSVTWNAKELGVRAANIVLGFCTVRVFFFHFLLKIEGALGSINNFSKPSKGLHAEAGIGGNSMFSYSCIDTILVESDIRYFD